MKIVQMDHFAQKEQVKNINVLGEHIELLLLWEVQTEVLMSPNA